MKAPFKADRVLDKSIWLHERSQTRKAVLVGRILERGHAEREREEKQANIKTHVTQSVQQPVSKHFTGEVIKHKRKHKHLLSEINYIGSAHQK